MKEFYIEAQLHNLDGGIPAYAGFLLPSTLPQGSPLNYRAIFDPCSNAYRVTSQPILEDLARLSADITLYDPAILHTGQVMAKDSNIKLPVSSFAGPEGVDHEPTLADQSILALLSRVREPSVALQTSKREDSFTKCQGDAFYDGSCTNSIDALDLAKPRDAKVSLPDHLDLALNEDQAEGLPSLLLAVDRGRLSTVTETLAEAYAENGSNQLACVAITDGSCTAETSKNLEQYLFEAGPGEKVPVVSLPGTDGEPRRPFTTKFSTPRIEHEIVESMSCIDFDFTTTSSEVCVKLGGQCEDEKSISSPIVSSSDQSIQSRQVSADNSSVTTADSTMAEAVPYLPTKYPDGYPRPWVRIEMPFDHAEPFQACTEPVQAEIEPVQIDAESIQVDAQPVQVDSEPISIQSNNTQGSYTTNKEGDELPTINSPEASSEQDIEPMPLSKSQKKRQRQARKRRARALEASQPSTLDQLSVTSSTSHQTEPRQQKAISEGTLETDSQSSNLTVKDPEPTTPIGSTTIELAFTSASAESKEREDAASAAAITPNSAETPSASGNTRTAESDTKWTLTAELDAAFGKLPEKWADLDDYVHKARRVLEESKPQGKSKYSYILFAMRHLRPPGFAQIRILQEADRSLAWFQKFFNFGNPHAARIIEADKAEDLANSEDSAPVLSKRYALAVRHHLNYISQWVIMKSATPPEVSLWAAITCYELYKANKLPRATSSKAVLISQAWKYVDPWTYAGPQALLNLRGTELRNAVVGLVEKVYHPFGLWGFDHYGEDENVPLSATQVQKFSSYYSAEKREAHFDALKPYSLDPRDDCTYVAQNGPWLSSPPKPPKPSPLRFAKTTDHVDDTELVAPSAPVAITVPLIGYEPTTEYHQSDEEIDADNVDFYGATDANIPDNEPIPVVAGAATHSGPSNHQDSAEEQSRRREQLTQEWLATFSDSPDRIRNQMMKPLETPTIFRQRPVIEIDEADSEAQTDIEMEGESDLAFDDNYDGHQVIDDEYHGPQVIDDRFVEPAAVMPATDVEFESNIARKLETVVEREEDEEEPDSEAPAPDKVIPEDVCASSIQCRSKLIRVQVAEDLATLPPVPETDESTTSFDDGRSRQISGAYTSSVGMSSRHVSGTFTSSSGITSRQVSSALTSSSVIHSRQVSAALTPPTPLSPNLPAISEEVSVVPDTLELQELLAVLSDHNTPVTGAEMASSNSSLNVDDRNPLPTSSEEPLQESTSDSDSMQIVLYEPRPRWFNILMLFARSLKRATYLLYKSGPTVSEAVNASENADVGAPEDLNLLSDSPEFDEDYFGKSTIYVGKQGIKVAKAAVQIGMMPVHAGMEVAKTPYKAMKTTWKVGKWAWSRFGRRF